MSQSCSCEVYLHARNNHGNKLIGQVHEGKLRPVGLTLPPRAWGTCMGTSHTKVLRVPPMPS